jgi:hypothetical protein
MARVLPVKQLASGIDTRLSPQIMTGRGNFMVLPKTLAIYVFVAQLDRAPDYESGGWGFESLRGHHFMPL